MLSLGLGKKKVLDVSDKVKAHVHPRIYFKAHFHNLLLGKKSTPRFYAEIDIFLQ